MSSQRLASPRSKDLLLFSVITHEGKLPLELKSRALAVVQWPVDKSPALSGPFAVQCSEAQGALSRLPAAHTRFTWSANGTHHLRHAEQAAGLTWSSESRISRSLFLVDLQGMGPRLQQGSLYRLGACQPTEMAAC